VARMSTVVATFGCFLAVLEYLVQRSEFLQVERDVWGPVPGFGQYGC